jgi:hypothetical protein
MKKLILFLLFLLFVTGSKAQEQFGNTLNVGTGIGYYGYAPSISANYEFDLFRNFTLAPFTSVITYKSCRYWGDQLRPYRNYYYRETTIPIGLKTTYYFDEWLHAGDRWDFYAGTSLGIAYRTTVWEPGYDGNRNVRRFSSPLYVSLHIGSECHLTKSLGVYVDLSTGLSTFGIGFHF